MCREPTAADRSDTLGMPTHSRTARYQTNMSVPVLSTEVPFIGEIIYYNIFRALEGNPKGNYNGDSR